MGNIIESYDLQPEERIQWVTAEKNLREEYRAVKQLLRDLHEIEPKIENEKNLFGNDDRIPQKNLNLRSFPKKQQIRPCSAQNARQLRKERNNQRRRKKKRQANENKKK